LNPRRSEETALSDGGGETSSRRLVIAVSGLHGSGKSVHAKRLAKTFGLRHVSAGMLFRRMAEERDMTLEEMSRLAKEDPEIDRLLDDRTKMEASKGGVVIDAALSGWMVKNADIKIFLTAPFEARVRRIAARDCASTGEAREVTRLREEVERDRFRKYYGIDIYDLSIYDVVLNTELFIPDGTAGILKRIVEEYRSGR
jgi:cytidylate kinase